MSVHIHLKDGRDVKVEASKIDFGRMVPDRHKAENLNRVSDQVLVCLDDRDQIVAAFKVAEIAGYHGG